MDWLNYHHLLYFWVVAREGSIARACEELHLSQPTISSQIRELEKSLGDRLFTKVGRNLVMSETGRIVYQYADEIFGLGRELRNALKGRPRNRPLRFVVGAADVLPKLIVHRLLEPSLRLPEAVQLVVLEDRPDRLLAQLSLHELDLVLNDAPIAPTVKVRAFNHLLGECGVSFFAAPALLRSCSEPFPQSLSTLPVLLPTEQTSLRRALDQWFEEANITPIIHAEFTDSALMKVFGQSGAGVFPAPSVVEEEIKRQYQVECVGRTEAIRERFYAISVERRLKHPATVAISEAARNKLFS